MLTASMKRKVIKKRGTVRRNGGCVTISTADGSRLWERDFLIEVFHARSVVSGEISRRESETTFPMAKIKTRMANGKPAFRPARLRKKRALIRGRRDMALKKSLSDWRRESWLVQ
jgi:hypothetical protein